MAHYSKAMYHTLGKYSSYFVDWAGKIKNLSIMVSQDLRYSSGYSGVPEWTSRGYQHARG